MDCRHDGAGFVAEQGSSRVFRMSFGEGKLADKRGGDRERNIRHLTKNAKRIQEARAADGGKGRVWVHCAQGINRGPAGLMAYLLLHTDAPSLKAVQRMVKARRAKARTRSNTFATELEEICRAASKPLE